MPPYRFRAALKRPAVRGVNACQLGRYASLDSIAASRMFSANDFGLAAAISQSPYCEDLGLRGSAGVRERHGGEWHWLVGCHRD